MSEQKTDDYTGQRQLQKNWRDSTTAVMLDVLSKIIVMVGTPVIGWVLLMVIEHGNRLEAIEQTSVIRSLASDHRIDNIEATAIRMESKIDRLIERQQITGKP